MSNMPILNEGQNCWRKARAARAAFLIDGAAYFEALWEAVKKAQKSLYIAAWDIDSRTELQRRIPDENPASRLGDFLNAVVKQAPELDVYILAWDFPMLYLREREPLPGILAITVFADRVAAAARNPACINIAVAGGIAIVLALGLWLTQKRLRAN